MPASPSSARPSCWLPSQGHAAAVQLLLDHGASLGAQDEAGHTAVHLAAAAGHSTVLEQIEAFRPPQLLAGRLPHVDAAAADGTTALMLAVVAGFPAAAAQPAAHGRGR